MRSYQLAFKLVLTIVNVSANRLTLAAETPR